MCLSQLMKTAFRSLLLHISTTNAENYTISFSFCSIKKLLQLISSDTSYL